MCTGKLEVLIYFISLAVLRRTPEYFSYTAAASVTMGVNRAVAGCLTLSTFVEKNSQLNCYKYPSIDINTSVNITY